MKLVRGVVREDKVNEIIAGLDRIGAPGITITEVKGRGAHAHMGTWRGLPYPVLRSMCAIEVIAADEAAEEIARVIVDGAHTGHQGDGHVFVMTLDDAYAVRTRWRQVA
jgi:nitrogen regulatory protein PII